MAKSNGAAATQGADAAAAKFSIDALIKAQTNITNDMLEGQFRNSKVKKDIKQADVDRINTGQVNSALREGEVFKIVGMRILEQPVRGSEPKTLLIYIVQNPSGDQRAIYASTLFRSNPTAKSENNDYPDDVINFDRGILQGTNGAGATKMTEKLVGNGSDYIRVADSIQFVTNAVRQQPGPMGEPVGEKFEIPNRVFRLEHITEAEAMETLNS